MAEALYRKYRPQVFGDVVGQDHVERTLRNAIGQDKVSHAYLFCGPRGTGKTTTARLLAKALLCEKAPTPEPDGSCEDCLMVAAGGHPDVYELDAASRTGVENVREEIIGRVQFAPTRGAKKVYIIDEVHMLSTAAFNALLKTLEEPPSHVVFILCTTDPQKVPETIHSRCQRFDFRRISSEEIVTRLGAICMAEGVEFDGDALDLIAHRAEGGMRNALTALEQAITYGAGRVSLGTVESLVGSLDTSDLAKIVGVIGRRDVPACFAWTASYVETGADLAQFARDLAERVRTMYVLSVAGLDAPADVSDAERREIGEELSLFGPDRLARMLAVLGDLIAELKTSTNARLSFEIALTRMVRPEADLTLAALAERVEELERRVCAGEVADAGAVPSAAAAPESPGDLPPAVQFAGSAAPSAAEPVSAFRSAAAPVSAPAVSSGSAARPEDSRQAASPQTDARPVAQGGSPPERSAGSRSAEAGSRSAGSRSAEAAYAVSPAEGAAGMSDALAAKLANPAALQRAWQAAVAALKRDKAAYAVLLVTARAAFDASSRALAIEFPAESEFAFKAVQRPEVVEAVRGALFGELGECVSFSFVRAGSVATGAVRTAEAAEAPLSVSRPLATPNDFPSVRTADPVSAAAASSPAAFAPAMPAQTRREAQAEPQAQAEAQAQAQARPQTQAQVEAQIRARSASASVSADPADGPPYEEVPADVYDAVPVDVYDDAGWVPAAAAAAAPPAVEPAAPPAVDARPAPASRAAQPSPEPPSAQTGLTQPSPEPRAAQPSPAQPSAAGADAERADLERLLSSAFGEGVVVEEV